jgi:2-desacetyl-2-hydroxyethyl bacteriochlorophyllide A dehydrogenase
MHRKRLEFDGRQVVLCEEELSPPGAGEVRVRTEWTQISIGTEIAHMLKAAERVEPMGIGYSHVGIVEELGAGVTNLKTGQRVLNTAAHATAVNASASQALVIPEGLGPDLATIGILGSVAHHIVERAGPRLLEPTAVIGLGVVGSIVFQLTQACGARPLIAIDADPARLAMHHKLGADYVVDASKENVPERVKSLTVKSLTGGQGVALCIEAAANARAYETAVAIMRLRGRIVLTSAVLDPVSFRINDDLILRELSLIGAHQPKCPTEPNLYYPWTQPMNRMATMESIRAGRLKVEHLISHRIKPADAPAIYERLMKKDRSLVGVLIDWS